MRIDRVLDLGRLAHHCVIERGPPGRIQQDHIVGAELCRFECPPRDLRGGLSLHDRQRVDLRLAAKHCELFHGGRPTHVERRHQNLPTLTIDETFGDLGGCGGLTGALQTNHHDGQWRRGIEIDAQALGTQRRDQLIVNDFHDHLAWRHRFHDLDADRLLLDAFDEGASHIERDIGFKQCSADFTQRFVDIGFTQRAATREAIKDATKPFRKIIEHQSANTFAPEGASRCRAVASGLFWTGRRS